jgi:CubicO group peptidase (beta-lactamase class C family)
MDLMRGFPPSKENLVTLANWRTPPFNRWAFNHVSELVPSASVRTSHLGGESAAVKATPLTGFKVDFEGRSYDAANWLDETFTDSMVVLKNGEVVYETYAPGQDAQTPHIWMSVSKSVLGLVAGVVAGRGQLDVQAPVTQFVPEVKGSVFDGTTVRDLLDMRVGIKFDEDYHAKDGAIIEYRKSHLWDPIPVGESGSDLRTFLSGMTARDGDHNDRFHYVSPNTDLLGWVVERASGQRYADLLSEVLWQPLRSERDAYITVDRFGAPRCAGGFCAVPRDMARLGRLFVTGGKANDQQVVPAAWLEDILQSGDPSAWQRGDFYEFFGKADMHYRSKWYVLRGERPLVFGVGVFGQNVFIDPKADLVIAKCSSQPLPLDQRFADLTMHGVTALRNIFG